MSAAAQQIVDSFDFAASRRFIHERIRQVRQEVRSYAAAISVLIVAGGAQHILRHPGDYWAFDRTDGAFTVLLVILTAFATWRLIVLRQLPGSFAGGPAFQRLSGREEGRVKRERWLAATAILIFIGVLMLLALDSILDGAWLFAAAFAILGIGVGSTFRLYIGARARRRAERYIAGEIGAAEYTSGRDPDHDEGPVSGP